MNTTTLNSFHPTAEDGPTTEALASLSAARDDLRCELKHFVSYTDDWEKSLQDAPENFIARAFFELLGELQDRALKPHDEAAQVQKFMAELNARFAPAQVS